MVGTINGRLGKDAEVATSSGGTQYVKFTLAENVFRNGKDETIWYDITSYDPFVLKYQVKALKKGSFAIVMGDVDARVNVGKNGGVYLNTHITATNIKVPNLGSGERKQSETPETPATPQEAKPTVSVPEMKIPAKTTPLIPQLPEEDGGDDDLPF